MRVPLTPSTVYFEYCSSRDFDHDHESVLSNCFLALVFGPFPSDAIIIDNKPEAYDANIILHVKKADKYVTQNTVNCAKNN